MLLALAALPARSRRRGDGEHRAGHDRRLPVRPRRPRPRARRRRRARPRRSPTPTAVEATRGASYFDLALARLAGVLAAGRVGDEVGGRHWLDLLGAWRRRSATSCSSPSPSCCSTVGAADGERQRVLAAGPGLAPHRRLRRRRLSAAGAAPARARRSIRVLVPIRVRACGAGPARDARMPHAAGGAEGWDGTVRGRVSAGHRPRHRPLRPAAPRALVPHRAGGRALRAARRVRQQQRGP